MADPVTQTASDVLKRRSTRLSRIVPLRVTGVDALGRSFDEHTWTSIISCHGGRYQSKYYVFTNEWVTLEIPCVEPARAQRRVRGRVTWIQRPRETGDPFHFGVEFEIAGNFWGVSSCPPDWFPFPLEGASPERLAPWPEAPMVRSVEGHTFVRGCRTREGGRGPQ